MAFLIIVLSYASMFYNIQRTGTQTTKYSNHIKNEVTIAKRFFSIVVTDSLCWIPIFILKILSLLHVEIPGTVEVTLLRPSLPNVGYLLKMSFTKCSNTKNWERSSFTSKITTKRKSFPTFLNKIRVICFLSCQKRPCVLKRTKLFLVQSPVWSLTMKMITLYWPGTLSN